MTELSADVIVVGHGLAGLVATSQIVDAGKSVLLIDQEGPGDFGGQGYWSFGGLFMVNTPEQKLCGVKDSRELAWQDWLAAAQFSDSADDHWGRKWAESYVDFASGEKRRWLRSLGWRAFPLLGWPERGGHGALGSGNSVPRFHITWGTGPGLVEVFARRVLHAESRGLVRRVFRHRVERLDTTDGQVTGVHGKILENATQTRGAPSTQTEIGEFTARASAVLLATGGVGGNPTLVRELFTQSFGNFPDEMLCGNPAHVTGKMLGVAKAAGANVVNQNRLWFYPDGVTNVNPIWPDHGIHLNTGPSALWLEGSGQRMPPPLYPNFDGMGAVRHIMETGFSYTWLILNHEIFRREFGMSGQELNPALTDKHPWMAIKGLLKPAISSHAQEFLERGVDFVTASSVTGLAAQMSAVPNVAPVDAAVLEQEIRARDSQVGNPFSKDPQIMAIHNARRFWPDWFRIAKPAPILDPKAGPLIAIKLHITTRKTLGGLQTDLNGRVLTPAGDPLSGLYAAGELTGFGGGGIHGHRSLEGTFVGGCVFSGRVAGRSVAKQV